MSLVACDSSTMIAFFHNEKGNDVSLLRKKIADGQLILPPPVVSELLSNHLLHPELALLVAELPRLEITEGFWERVGNLRAIILKNGKKARLADAMIAQCCMDAHVSLITRDNDFRHYVTYAGLVTLP